MNEIILNKKKNGMFVMLLTIMLYIIAIAHTVIGGIILDNGGNAFLFAVVNT